VPERMILWPVPGMSSRRKFRLPARSSVAVDAGLDAGVAVDLDGQARPNGAGFDVGADEFCPPWRVYLPGVWRQSP
jgi:hypothetical protein